MAAGMKSLESGKATKHQLGWAVRTSGLELWSCPGIHGMEQGMLESFGFRFGEGETLLRMRAQGVLSGRCWSEHQGIVN